MKTRLHKLLVVRDAGHVTPFVVIIIVALFAVAALVFDGGLALSTKTRAMDVAQSAARAGAQELNLDLYRATGITELDPALAASAARNWLSTTGYSGEVNATSDEVTVTVRATHPTRLLNLVGVGELTVTATASSTPLHGVSGPES